ncbi:MAG: hypothetical protein ACLS61_07975 [Ruminococcus sp.]
MKQQKLVEKMTIEEKAAILSGKTVWQTELAGFPSRVVLLKQRKMTRLIMSAEDA